MQTIVGHKHFNTAKQMCFTPSIWSNISYGRIQERVGVQETKV